MRRRALKAIHFGASMSSVNKDIIAQNSPDSPTQLCQMVRSATSFAVHFDTIAFHTQRLVVRLRLLRSNAIRAAVPAAIT
jgi:hypothetical protein